MEILQVGRSLVTAEQRCTIHRLDVTTGDADARLLKAIIVSVEIVNGIGSTG